MSDKQDEVPADRLDAGVTTAGGQREPSVGISDEDRRLWAAVEAAQRELQRVRAEFYQRAGARRDVFAEALRGRGWGEVAALDFLDGLWEDVPLLVEELVALVMSERHHDAVHVIKRHSELRQLELRAIVARYLAAIDDQNDFWCLGRLLYELRDYDALLSAIRSAREREDPEFDETADALERLLDGEAHARQPRSDPSEIFRAPRAPWWEHLRELTDTFLDRPLGPGDGFTAEELDAAQARLGLVLPVALREAYALFGRRRELTAVQDRFLPPQDLRVENDVLVYRVEAQGVFAWGVRVENLATDDPPVVRLSRGTTPGSQPWADRLTNDVVRAALAELVHPDGAGTTAWTSELDHGFRDLAPSAWSPAPRLTGEGDGRTWRRTGGAFLMVGPGPSVWVPSVWVRTATPAGLAAFRDLHPGPWRSASAPSTP